MENYIYLFVLVLILSCANVIKPNGGPIDRSPPIVLKLVPSNNSTNFNEEKIIIYFDENVVVNNIGNIHTQPEPNLIEKINTTAKGLEIYLKKDLINKTTYIIDFQGAITDLNEGNKLSDFKYVFSTGDIIDSSVVYGKVTELEYNKVITNGLVGLYIGDVIEEFDSLIRVKKPDFFCFTNKEGGYNYTNLKNGTYTLMCINDENLNLKYEKNELVSMPKLVNLKDSIEKNINVFLDERYIYLIQENDSLKELNRQNDSLIIKPEYGFLNLFFNNNIYRAKNYIGQITQKDKVLNTFNIHDSIITIDSIKTGSYQLRLIQDLNNNQKWDSGNIKTLKNPENIFFFKDSIKIRSNWELNLNIDI